MRSKLQQQQTFSLCPRCEFRAMFIETGSAYRYECSTGHSWCCYAYRPTLPFVIQKDKGDPRPMFAPTFISARSCVTRVARIGSDVNAKTVKVGKGQYMTTWTPTQFMILSQEQLKTLSKEQLATLINIIANTVAKTSKKKASYLFIKTK